LDKETRGTIENSLDEMIRGLDINDITGWIVEEYPITSVKDLALGYVLGSFARYAYTLMLSEKWGKQSKKRLEKEAGREVAERINKSLENAVKDMKPLRVNLTEKDYVEIREMLKRRILDIQGIIDRELNR